MKEYGKHKTNLAKVSIQFSEYTYVTNQRLLLCIKIFDKNAHCSKENTVINNFRN